MHRMLFTAGLLLLWMMAPGAVQAEDYRLREPGVSEYLEAIPGILAAWREQIPLSYTKITENPVVQAILFELQQYAEEELFGQPFDLLAPAYDALASATFGTTVVPVPALWEQLMLLAWLRDNPTDLSQVEILDVPGYVIKVSALDFDGDGRDEFSLDLRFNWLNAYLVLQQDATAEAGYRLVDTPLPWLDSSLNFGGLATDYQSVYFGDMNGDEIPEWVVESYRNNDCSRLIIMTWRNGKLVDLSGEASHFCLQRTVAIENADDEPDLEILVRQSDLDNWGCETTITSQMKWNGTQFERRDDAPDEPDTWGCALRDAELLMWQGRVADAISLYEGGLAADEPEPTQYSAELERYARVRLALAYALVGRMDESSALLRAVTAEPSTSEAIDRMAEAMAAAETAGERCAAAYNVWAEYERSTYSYRAIPILVQVGRQGWIGNMMEDYPPEPEKAGCDAPAWINAELAEMQFPIDQSPADRLRDAGTEINDVLVADLDEDGEEEWLVWLVAAVDPVLFVAEDDAYTVSRPPIRTRDEYTSVSVQLLVRDSAPFLVEYLAVPEEEHRIEYYFAGIHQRVLCTGDGVGWDGRNLGHIRLWRLQKGQLISAFDQSVCGYYPLADLFRDAGRGLTAAAIHVWIGPLPERDSRYSDQVYRWDDVEKTYVPPSISPLMPTPWPTYPASYMLAVTDGAVLETLSSALSLIDRAAPEAALKQIEDTVSQPDLAVEEIALFGLRYYRALVLKVLERPSEALAEYVAIYEAAPESAWGMLAALHLEVIDGE